MVLVPLCHACDGMLRQTIGRSRFASATEQMWKGSALTGARTLAGTHPGKGIDVVPSAP